VGARAPVAAVGPDVERDAGALIDAAGLGVEADAQGDLVPRAVARPHREREERERLHAVEELGVTLSVEPLRLVREARRRRSLPPLRAVDEQPLLPARFADVPVA